MYGAREGSDGPASSSAVAAAPVGLAPTAPVHEAETAKGKRKKRPSFASSSSSSSSSSSASSASAGKNELASPTRKSSASAATALSDGKKSRKQKKPRVASKRSKPSASSAVAAAPAKICNRCGRRDHQRSNSVLCPFNKKSQGAPAPAQRARGAKTSAPTSNASAGLTEWTPCRVPDEYVLRFAEESRNEFFVPRVSQQCKAIVANVQSEANSMFPGNDGLRSLTPFQIFMLIAKGVLARLALWTSKRIRAAEKDQAPLSLGQFMAVLGVYLWTQLVGMKCELILECFESSVGIPLPLRQRFLSIVKHISAVDPDLAGPRGAGFGETGDIVQNVRTFEGLLFRRTRLLVASRNQNIVVEDELVATKSEEAPKRAASRRKAGKDGIKCVALADALTRIMLCVKHQARLDGNQSAVASELLNEAHSSGAAAAAAAALCGTVLSGDRGYSKADLWSKARDLGAGFLMVSDTSASPFTALSKVLDTVVKKERAVTGVAGPTKDTAQHSVQRAKAVGIHRFTEALVVRDDAQLGREVFGATCTSQRDGKPEVMTAIAFRDYQAKAADTPSRVVHFVECGTGLGEKLLKTMCMSKMNIPSGTKVRADLLFYPCEKKNKAKLVVRVEKDLRDRGVVPCTCWQRSADWFVLRAFCISATTSGQLARNAPAARALLIQPAADKESGQDEVDEEGGESDDEEAMNSDASDDSAQRASDGGVHGDSGDDGDGCSSDGISADGCNGGQRSVWASEESNGEGWESPWADESAGDSEAHDTLADGAKTLMRSWFFARGASTPAPRSGALNEANLFKAIGRTAWCEAIFRVGLVAMEDHPYLAVSSDGIARVRAPGAQLDDKPVLASVRFKTRSARTPLKRAARIAARVGQYFSCTVGDRDWWRTVPLECRGQVLHQAMVLGLDHVLYVEGTMQRMLFACLVEVPKHARDTYRGALTKYGPLMDWAHDSVSVAGPPPVAPAAFSAVEREVIASHMRLWRAVRKHVAKSGPLHPIRSFHTLAQEICNCLKGGIDGSSQDVAEITPPSVFQLSLQQQVAFRGLKQLVSNAFVIYRTVRACSTQDGPCFRFTSLEGFRRGCNEVLTMKEFTFILAKALVRASVDTQYSAGGKEARAPMGPVVGQAPKEPANKAKMTTEDAKRIIKGAPFRVAAKLTFFDGGLGKRVRLNTELSHSLQPLGQRETTAQRRVSRQGVCIVCGGRASHSCSLCLVPLHVVVTEGQKTNCFHKFHTRETVQGAKETK